MATPKPWTVKPFITAATNHNISPLITRVNKPRVRIFTGSVTRMTIGLITALTMPKTSEPQMAPKKVTSNPLISAAAKMIATAFNSHLFNHPCTLFASFKCRILHATAPQRPQFGTEEKLPYQLMRKGSQEFFTAFFPVKGKQYRFVIQHRL